MAGIIRRLFLFQVQFLNMLSEIANKTEKRKGFKIEIKKTGNKETVERHSGTKVAGDELSCNFSGISNHPYPILNASDSAIKVKKELVKELIKIKNVNGFNPKTFNRTIRFDTKQKVIQSINYFNNKNGHKL